jgi:hypothetical protein
MDASATCTPPVIPPITDGLPHRIWTRDEQGDPAEILEWVRVGGGWRCVYPDGSDSHAHSTRALRIYRPWFTTDPRKESSP